MLPAVALAVDDQITCDSDLNAQRRSDRSLVMSRNFGVIHSRTGRNINAIAKKCNPLAREILGKLADVDREIISKNVLARDNIDELFEYCSRIEDIDKLTRVPECR